jgi:DNA-binding FadR family transcriptional regulator
MPGKPFCQVDNRIHVAIAEAAGNRVYEFVLRMVHDNIQQYYEAHPLKDQHFMQENYQDLCDIVSAIEKRQATAVRSLMQSHVRRFNRYMNNPDQRRANNRIRQRRHP